jgi:hypothetical protein
LTTLQHGKLKNFPFKTYTYLKSRTSAFDKNTQTEKPLTAEELDLIRRLYANENPDGNYDPYEPMTEWFTGKGKEEIMPLSGALQPKRRWVPSKWEKQKVLFNIESPVQIPDLAKFT